MRMRQQIEARQNRALRGSDWFRAGVLSATVLAPLIARWNDLRTSNRAQTLRELAAARISDARDAGTLATRQLAPLRSAANARLEDVRTLANSRLGSTRELANARLEEARELASARLDDALVRLAQVNTPEMLQNVPPFSLAKKRAEELARRRRRTTMLWLAGVGIGLAAAGVTAYVIARRRMAVTLEEEEPMVELPPETKLAEATAGRAAAMRGSYTTAERAEVNVPQQASVPAGATAAGDQAPYIGNIHTMIFHDADDVAHLPAEENRIYFSSEAEARQAGYRHAREPEVQTGGENQ